MSKVQSFLSGVDNRTAIIMAGSIMGLLVICGLQVFAVVWRNQPFDAVSFGAGFGGWVASTGGGLGLHTMLSAGPVSQGKSSC